MNSLHATVQSFRTLPATVWIDAAMILGFLVLANSLAAPLDFGWLDLHPSPYFLLPVLLGCRYGFAAGILAGLLTAALIIAGLRLLDEPPYALLLRQQGYFFGALALAGAVCGEIQRGFRRKDLQRAANHERLQRRLRDLEIDLSVLREAKAELAGLLATQDSELSTLDNDLRRLFDADEESLFPSLLLLLNRQIRVSDAAIYLVGEESSLVRKARFGQSDRLPERMNAEKVEMVGLALKNKTTVTLPEVWKGEIPRHANFLIVVPFIDSDETVMGVLIVAEMPFIALNSKAVNLITLTCRWASRIVERRTRSAEASRTVSGLDHQRIFHKDFFREHVELALRSYRTHGLPSSIVLFTVPPDSGISQERMEAAIMATVRSGDCPTVLDLPCAHLAVLLPLTGDRGVSIFVNRILMNCRKDRELAKHIRSRWIRFESKETLEEIWSELTSHVEEHARVS